MHFLIQNDVDKYAQYELIIKVKKTFENLFKTKKLGDSPFKENTVWFAMVHPGGVTQQGEIHFYFFLNDFDKHTQNEIIIKVKKPLIMYFNQKK